MGVSQGGGGVGGSRASIYLFCKETYIILRVFLIPSDGDDAVLKKVCQGSYTSQCWECPFKVCKEKNQKLESLSENMRNLN